MPAPSAANRHPATVPVVVVGLALPTLITWVYFVLFSENATDQQQAAYALGKSLQFVLPLVWVFGIVRSRPALDRRGDSHQLATGLGFGLVVALLIVAAYFLDFRTQAWMIAAAEQVQTKVAGLGINSAARFTLMGVLYSVIHAFLEEYYWRWFVFGELERITSAPVAIGISSVGFMAHHIVLLATFFGWTSPWTYLFSVSVAVGGVAWAWMYHRTGTLWSPWASHLLVDAAIFTVGFDLARPLWQSPG